MLTKKKFFQQLVSGSSGTEQQDERANSPDDGSTDVGKGDGYTEGIPGPVTRLFVLANRGLSNLIQDLILVRRHQKNCLTNNCFDINLNIFFFFFLFRLQRIAQTSERVVNFKARLITSLI